MRDLRTYLKPDLIRQARLLEEYTGTIRALMPPGLKEHCWVVGIQGDTLSLLTDSAIHAHPLRYMRREIIKQMKDHHGMEIKDVRLRVRPGIPDRQTRPGPGLPELNASARHALRTAASSVSDPELEASLNRLAGR